MKTGFLYKFFPCVLFMHSSLILAASPVTVTYNSGTSNFASNASGAANYVVSVGSIIPRNTPITFNFTTNSSGGLTATQISTGSSLCTGVSMVCGSTTFSLSANQSCCLEFALVSSSAGSYSLQPAISSIPAIYKYTAPSATSVTVSEATNSTPLTATPSTLALSVDCQTTGGSCVYSNAALTGTAREVTIQNTSTTDTTTPLTVTPAGFPSDTSIIDNCTGVTLAPLGSCSIIITPGQIATSDCTSGTQPSPGTVTVNASSAPSAVSSDVVVLSYGCIYQGGFVYSIDDTTPTTGSIAGKTAAVNDTYAGQTSPPLGDPNWGGFGTDVSPNGSTYQNNSAGANDGSANTTTIITTLGCTSSTSPSYAACLCANLSVDAAGSSCISPSTCYIDWYLPAICELGPNASSCAPGSTNIQEQLYNASPAITANLVDAGFYWSSTEYSGDPGNVAFIEIFNTGGSFQSSTIKSTAMGIRCSRGF